MKTANLFIVFVLLLGITASSCKDKKDDEITPEDSFDKSGMLTNIGNNIIVSSYLNLNISLDSLQVRSSQFTANPTLITLSELQSQFSLAYSAYQSCSAFEFGPAENEYIRSNFNTFPCDTLQINSKITTAEYTLSAATDIDAKGFPGLDFLLYGNSMNNNQVLARFTSAADAANAKLYLTAVVNELKAKTNIVYNGWSSAGGNYISTFKSNTANDVGGSISMLVNQLNYDMELLKNAKVGIPLGKKTLGVPQPSKVEALYS
ncbi:MAG: imelysin family protein, partial [Bacteroidetes bacterium]|nr:imelysin family protein [Bacteroidota bacterium]